MTKIIEIGFILVIVLLLCLSCTGETLDLRSEGNTMPTKSINEVLKEHVKILISVPGVVGAGQGLCEGKPCIKVYVIEKTLEMEQKIPHYLDGYPVMVEETGPIKALPKK